MSIVSYTKFNIFPIIFHYLSLNLVVVKENGRLDFVFAFFREMRRNDTNFKMFNVTKAYDMLYFLSAIPVLCPICIKTKLKQGMTMVGDKFRNTACQKLSFIYTILIKNTRKYKKSSFIVSVFHFDTVCIFSRFCFKKGVYLLFHVSLK